MGVGRQSFVSRSSYPSGRRMVSSSNYSQRRSPSSARIFGKVSSSRSGSSTPPEPPNPNPNNYRITAAETVGRFLIVCLKYPDCTNYEGNKILVYEGVKLEELVNQGEIDPHFFDDPKYKSPVARFVPTKKGLTMAKTFAKACS